MKKSTTKTSLFGAALALAAVMFAASPAKGQYESFFGQESWEYATAFHPITKSTADYDPHLLYCLTNIYHFSSSDTVTIDGKVYYNSSVDGYWYRPVKLREDTLYGRLYSLIDGREFLMCDMSLNVGDTFRLPVSRDYDYDETMRMLVDSVTFVNSKKVIHLSAVSESDAYWWFSFLSLEEAYNISLRFMEGVGPMYGLFPPYCDGDVLLCLTKDDSLYYMTHPDIGCWQDYVSVSDYPEQSITIFPNPAKDQISVLFETDEEVEGSIVIRDMTGRVCRTFTVSGKNTSLNVSFLSQGMYFLTYTDGIRTVTRKFMKE
jgi:hypothetical protein